MAASTSRPPRYEMNPEETRGQDEPLSARSVAGELVRDLQGQRSGQRRGPTGVATGLRDLDAKIGGFQASELVVIAGRPGMGASTLLTNIAEHAALDDPTDSRCVLFVSLQEPARAVARRLLASLGRIDLAELRSHGPWIDQELLTRALERLQDRPLYIVGGPRTMHDVHLHARQAARANSGLKAIFVDSLQWLLPDAEDGATDAEMLDPSRDLKTLARELQCPVLVTCRVSRRTERRDHRRPMLGDLHGPGAIEHEADVVLLLYREEVYRRDSDNQGMAEVMVAKHPATGPTWVYLRFEGRWGRFLDD